MLDEDKTDQITIFKDKSGIITGLVTYDTMFDDRWYLIHNNDWNLLSIMIEHIISIDGNRAEIKANSRDSVLNELLLSRSFHLEQAAETVLSFDLENGLSYTFPEGYATTRMKCEAIYANRALYSVRKMCEALKISQCQYYQWIRLRKNRENRKNREIWLVEAIRRIFIENREVYGCRKIRKSLEEEGIFVSEWKIRRIMKENGIYPQTRKKWKPHKKAKSDGMYSENKV